MIYLVLYIFLFTSCFCFNFLILLTMVTLGVLCPSLNKNVQKVFVNIENAKVLKIIWKQNIALIDVVQDRNNKNIFFGYFQWTEEINRLTIESVKRIVNYNLF